MKELFEQFIKIIEQSQEVREQIENNIKKYFEENKKQFEIASKELRSKWEESIKNLTNPKSLNEAMEKTMKLLIEFIGQDIINRLIEIQKKFPYLTIYIQRLFSNNTK